MTKKLLTVFGATGAQGGNLIVYILGHPRLSAELQLRGVTRDVTKPAAVALTNKGVEVVQADMDDLDSLKEAVNGSWAVFGMTNHWDHASGVREVAQGKSIADAAVAAGSKLLIWSSLPNVTKMSDGKLDKVSHFDSKAQVEDYIRTLPIVGVYFMPGFYMQNMLVYMRPKKIEEGIYEFGQSWNADTGVPLFDITDTGKFLAPVLLDPDRFAAKRLTAATAYYTGPEMAKVWTKVTHKQVGFKQIAPGSTRSAAFTPEMQEMLAHAAGLMTDYEYYGPSGREDLRWTLEQVSDGLTTWETFVQREEPWFA